MQQESINLQIAVLFATKLPLDEPPTEAKQINAIVVFVARQFVGNVYM